MNETAARLADQLAQVELDLAEVADQVASGEIDQATGDRLLATYRVEAQRLLAEVDAAATAVAVPPTGRSRWRVVTGGAILGVGAIVIVVAAVIAVVDRPGGGNLAGGVVSDALAGRPVDLSGVTNDEMEGVVAENPTIVPMRMALALRYFEAGEFDQALTHYLVVLDEQGVEDPEALANVGWMTALSGRPEIAEPFLERALEIQPEFPEAYWFMGNVQVALGNRVAAVAALDRLLSYDVPDDVRVEAERVLADLEAQP